MLQEEQNVRGLPQTKAKLSNVAFQRMTEQAIRLSKLARGVGQAYRVIFEVYKNVLEIYTGKHVTKSKIN